MSQRDFFTANPHHVRVDVVHSGGGSPITRQYNMNFVSVNSPFDVAPADLDRRMAQILPARAERDAAGAVLNGGAGFAWASKFGGGRTGRPASPGDQFAQGRYADLAHLDPRGTVVETAQPAVQAGSGGDVGRARRTVDIPVRVRTVLTLLTDGEAAIGRAFLGRRHERGGGQARRDQGENRSRQPPAPASRRGVGAAARLVRRFPHDLPDRHRLDDLRPLQRAAIAPALRQGRALCRRGL